MVLYRSEIRILKGKNIKMAVFSVLCLKLDEIFHNRSVYVPLYEGKLKVRFSDKTCKNNYTWYT